MSLSAIVKLHWSRYHQIKHCCPATINNQQSSILLMIYLVVRHRGEAKFSIFLKAITLIWVKTFLVNTLLKINLVCLKNAKYWGISFTYQIGQNGVLPMWCDRKRLLWVLRGICCLSSWILKKILSMCRLSQLFIKKHGEGCRFVFIFLSSLIT